MSAIYPTPPPPLPSLQEIHDRLDEHFSVPMVHDLDRLGPVSQLVHTLLHIGASDERADIAFRRLTARFWSWPEVRDTPAWRLAALIEDHPDAARKAEQIVRAITTVSDLTDWKNPSLDLLKEMDNAAALRWLSAIDGLTPSAAASILLLSTLRRIILPVDAPVLRVATRMGLISGREPSPQEALNALVPSDWKAADVERFYHQMRAVGRRFCAVRWPKCGACTLRGGCCYQSRQ
jgi:endonuclease III